MPIATKCPNCEASFRLADEMAGKRVKCQKCENVFTVPQAEAEETPPAPPPEAKPKKPPMMVIDDDEPEAKEAVTATPKKPVPPPKVAKDDDDEEDDDEPRSRRRGRARRDERPKAKSGGGMSGTMMAVLGVVLFSCICCGGAGPAAYFMFDVKPHPIRPQPPIVVADGFVKDKVIAPPKFDDFGKPKFDGPMFDGFKDQKKPTLPVTGINVVFAPDGSYRSDNSINAQDARNLSNKPHKLYLAQLEANATYQIDMTSKDFDSVLILLDSMKNLLRSDDDGGGFPNARIVFTPTKSELYRIEATIFGFDAKGNFTLSIRKLASNPVVVVPKIEPPIDPPKLDPSKLPGGSIAFRTIKGGPFVVNDLNLNVGPQSPKGGNEPCWDAEGTHLYWLHTRNTIYKINQRTLKLETVNILPQPCSNLVMSAEGLLTIASGIGEVWVLDPVTLAVRKKISAPGVNTITASHKSSMAFILTPAHGVVDLKAGTLHQQAIAKTPPGFIGLRVPAMSPDGKYVFVQSGDANFHRLRLQGNQLVYDASKPAAVKTQFHWAFSPDGKLMTMVHPGLASKVKNTEVYPIDNWNTPAYTLPIRMKELTFDGAGGIFANTDKGESRYYPNPAKQADVFTPLPPTGTANRLFAPPQGPGVLIYLSSTQVQWTEPAMK